MPSEIEPLSSPRMARINCGEEELFSEFPLGGRQQHLPARIICTETWNGCLSGSIGTPSCL